MLILAIDTSGRNGSVALCRGDIDRCDVLEFTILEGGTYSARLVPCIAEILQQAGLSKANIDAVAVVDTRTAKGMHEIYGDAYAAGCIYAPVDFAQFRLLRVQSLSDLSLVRVIQHFQKSPSPVCR